MAAARLGRPKESPIYNSITMPVEIIKEGFVDCNKMNMARRGGESQIIGNYGLVC